MSPFRNIIMYLFCIQLTFMYLSDLIQIRQMVIAHLLAKLQIK